MITTQPYEILYRFNADGTFKAAHFRTITTFTDDATGEVLFQKEGDPMTVEDAQVAGYSVPDISATATSAIASQISGIAVPV